MKARVSREGEVIIPEPLRRRLGIGAGAILDFAEEEGKLVARKVSEEDPIEAVCGILQDLGKSTDELITELRGEVDTI